MDQRGDVVVDPKQRRHHFEVDPEQDHVEEETHHGEDDPKHDPQPPPRAEPISRAKAPMAANTMRITNMTRMIFGVTYSLKEKSKSPLKKL